MGWLEDTANAVQKTVDDVVDGTVEKITENAGIEEGSIGSGDGPYEHALNLLIQTSWTGPTAHSMKDRVSWANDATLQVASTLRNENEYEGATASRAADYGEKIGDLCVEMDLEKNLNFVNTKIADANAEIERLRNRKDDLPGSRLDSFSEHLIGTLNTGACLVVPGLGVYELVTGNNPVGAINARLQEKRESKAEEILNEVRTSFQNNGLDVRQSKPIERPTPLEPRPYPIDEHGDTVWSDGSLTSSVDLTARQYAGARSLGGGRYDLDGDGVADYVNADGDGVPDYWLDRNGNRVSSDRVQGGIGVVSGAGVGSSGVPGSGQWGPGSVPLPVPGPGHAPVPVPVPMPVPMPDSGQSFAPSYPVGGGHVVDVDSVMTPGSAGFPGSTGMSGGAAGAGTVGGYASGVSPVSGMGMSGGLAVGAVGAVGAGVGGVGGVGSYFTNAPVRASVAPGGTLSGATGLAAGLRGSAPVAGPGGSGAGRSGMMGAPGASGTGDSKPQKRRGLGLVAPKLEDDDLEIRSLGLMAGHRIKPKRDDA